MVRLYYTLVNYFFSLDLILFFNDLTFSPTVEHLFVYFYKKKSNLNIPKENGGKYETNSPGIILWNLLYILKSLLECWRKYIFCLCKFFRARESEFARFYNFFIYNTIFFFHKNGSFHFVSVSELAELRRRGRLDHPRDRS